jgi:hypothetical protein
MRIDASDLLAGKASAFNQTARASGIMLVSRGFAYARIVEKLRMSAKQTNLNVMKNPPRMMDSIYHAVVVWSIKWNEC